MRRAAIILSCFCLGGVLAWIFTPALQGYHIGYNLATDNECAPRVLDWCKSTTPVAAAPVVQQPVVTQPTTQPASPATTQTVFCPTGFDATSYGQCVDQRHQPCPTGYTGWQNSQVDNCVEKP